MVPDPAARQTSLDRTTHLRHHIISLFLAIVSFSYLAGCSSGPQCRVLRHPSLRRRNLNRHPRFHRLSYLKSRKQ